MSAAIQPASFADKLVLHHLLQLYLYEFSAFDNADVNEHGLFGYKYLDNYWLDSGRHPFLIRVEGKLAGFVLVRALDNATHAIAEFFIMQKYRRQGNGKMAACHIFDMFPGQWHVAQEAANESAQTFWRQVIGEYTNGEYEEEYARNDEWHGPIQRFASRIG